MAEYRIYKPNKNYGAATAFQFRIDERRQFDQTVIFVQSAKQIGEKDGNAAFGWKEPGNTVQMKLEEIDIGQMLTVFNGVVESMGHEGKGIYHQNDNGNTTMTLQRSDKGYYYRLAKKGKDGVLVEVKHTISFAEGEIVRAFLMEALNRKLGF